MRVVYVAGPFRGPSAWAIEQNIRAAETLALEVWRLGAVALCPHGNTRWFQGALPDDVWLRGDLELLRRCDAVMLTPDWQRSTGATSEVEFALMNDLPVFETLAELQEWLADRPTTAVQPRTAPDSPGIGTDATGTGSGGPGR